MTSKIHVGILYGGQSCEHEVSVTSARCVYQALDKTRYDVSLLGITKTGQWMLADTDASILDAKTVQVDNQTPVSFDYQHSGNLVGRDKVPGRFESPGLMDVIFPVLHGPFGEDGTVQGMLELAGVAYVGSGVTGSAVGMDKAVAKSVFSAHGIPQSQYIVMRKGQWLSDSSAVLDTVENRLGYPVFVKPANLGSSVGISKAKNKDQLSVAIELAFQYDLKILIEQSLENCHEVEISVLGNDDPQTSVVGEIIPAGEFYDYSDKYIDNLTKFVIPADLPDGVSETISEYAKQAFLAIDAAGMARVDFFVHRATSQVYINEINTIPGFTPISMYPKMWQASGIEYPQLLDRLIQLALERRKQHDEKCLVL